VNAEIRFTVMGKLAEEIDVIFISY